MRALRGGGGMVPSGAAESGTGCAPEALTNEKDGRPDGAPTIEIRSRLKPTAAPAKSDQSSSSTETAPHPMPPSAWPSECGHGGGLPPYSHTWALNDADQRLRPDPQPYCSLPPPLDPESGYAMLLAPSAWRSQQPGESAPGGQGVWHYQGITRQHFRHARAHTRPACGKARRTKCCLPLQRRGTHSSHRHRSSGCRWARPRSSLCSESCSRRPTGPNAPRPPRSLWTAAARATGSSSGPGKGLKGCKGV